MTDLRSRVGPAALVASGAQRRPISLSGRYAIITHLMPRALEMDSWGDQRIADLLNSLDDVEAEHLNSVTLRDLLNGDDSIVMRIAAQVAAESSPAKASAQW